MTTNARHGHGDARIQALCNQATASDAHAVNTLEITDLDNTNALTTPTDATYSFRILHAGLVPTNTQGH